MHASKEVGRKGGKEGPREGGIEGERVEGREGEGGREGAQVGKGEGVLLPLQDQATYYKAKT